MNAVKKLPIVGLEVGKVMELAIDQLAPDGGQPRRDFGKADLAALTASIQARGVMQPILVRYDDLGTLFILDGERRWRAAKAAKLATVPVMLVERHDSGAQLRVDQVAVNELRTQLTPLEIGFLLRQLRDDMKLTPNDIAAYMAKNGMAAMTRAQVDDLIGLTDLPKWTHDLVNSGKVEVKALAPLRRIASMPEVLKVAKEAIEEHAEWGGQVTGRDVSDGVENALAEVGADLTREYGDDAVRFDWKTRCKGCEHLMQIDGRGYCMDRKLFDQHQTEAKEAGLGGGGKRIRGEGKAAGEREPTAAEKREKSQQRTQSLRGKATDYLHAHLMRALVPKINEVADQLMLFAALKRPNLYDSEWHHRGAPGCHYPDGREEPVPKLGSLKAAQDHKINALEAVLAKRTPKQRDAIVHSIALETLFELPFRETQVLAHHVLGDDIAKIWTLDAAFLELFRKGELCNLAKKHQVPLPEGTSAWESMKGSDLKAGILAHPKLMRKPQILVDLYGKIEKPSRHAFDA